MYTYIHIYMYMYIHVYTYIHMYIHIYTWYTYTHGYTHIHMCSTYISIHIHAHTPHTHHTHHTPAYHMRETKCAYFLCEKKILSPNTTSPHITQSHVSEHHMWKKKDDRGKSAGSTSGFKSSETRPRVCTWRRVNVLKSKFQLNGVFPLKFTYQRPRRGSDWKAL
jgi:hypothetical protein